MTCVAITRGGYGDAWLLESFDEADNHPLVQYGDVMISEPRDVLKQYSILDLHRLIEIIDDPDLSETVLASISRVTTGSFMSYQVAVHAEKIFRALVRVAVPVLTDPSDICEKVRADRIMYKEERHTMAKAKTTKKTPDAKPVKKAPRPPAFPPDATITMLKDKDGNVYGGKNNPKRDGSKSHARFAFYKNGMSVKKFIDAGGNIADLRNDVSKNYISVS